MCKLHLTIPWTIIKDEKEVQLTAPLYELKEESVAKDNGFFKCFKCGDYFDEIWQFNHPPKHPREHWNDREFCKVCYDKYPVDSTT